jgi:hypothetical protein
MIPFFKTYQPLEELKGCALCDPRIKDKESLMIAFLKALLLRFIIYSRPPPLVEGTSSLLIPE